MVAAIQAQESIQRINEQAFAFGSMSEERAQSYMLRLQQAAAMAKVDDEEKTGARPYRPRSPQELAALSGGSTMVIMEG